MERFICRKEKQVSILIETCCAAGKLIITDDLIRTQLGSLKSESLSRSNLVGLDYKMVAPSIFGMGGGANLTFHGKGGERLEAKYVKIKDAKQIMQLLGY